MDSIASAQAFYAGEFRHAIDEKNRITIPSRWRRKNTEEFILLPDSQNQFLLVMSPEEFARMSAAAESNASIAARERRIFCASCTPAPSTASLTSKAASFCRRNFAARS